MSSSVDKEYIKRGKYNLIWIKCRSETEQLQKGRERDHRTAQTPADEMQREAKSPTDSIIPDQNKCYVLSVFSFACFYLVAKMRSAQISILAPKRVISSNFFRGRLDKFSALNSVFIAKINN